MIYKFKEFKDEPLLINHLNMGGKNPKGEEINVTSRYFTRNGKPWIGVMGEFHFSRYSRENWHRELAKMKAGGITIVSTYLFWIYHEEIEGKMDFGGDNDIRAFIEECKDVGLDVVIRIGPWAHGECRNGGFPDWLLKKDYKLRDNNEEYLAVVKKWYQSIYNEVKGLFYKDGGNIIAVQIENEFVDNAEHLAKLKEIAVECGFIAPIYTVTGWNSASGAKIPVDEVMPVFGGYCEAPWENHMNRLSPSPHYFFNRMRNDSAIGTDLIAKTQSDGWQLPYERYPFATCELGGGIEVTHHRRPIIKPMDIYAVSLVKLGDGNNLVGYYMYHGGTNKIGELSTFNETKATGYPNDYPILSYDFQAPLSEYGEVREQYGLLNMLHMFVNDFGEEFAPMIAVDSANSVAVDDTNSLRYGMRTNGKSGFVFVNHYQRLTELADIENAVISAENVEFPPIDVKGEVSFFMPFNMKMGDSVLEYATAQPLCKCDDTYFFAEIPNIKAEYKFSKGSANIVTVPFENAKYMRKLNGTVYIGGGCNLYEENGQIHSVEDGEYICQKWNGSEFETLTIVQSAKQSNVEITVVENAPFEPKYKEELCIGGERELTWKKINVDGGYGFAEIDYVGDVAQIYADGELVADDYYYGKTWRVPCKLLYGKECYMV
ncbi:beta-galactosidase, partial [Hominilimicola sp.]|uniref:beta-galactosidase n=1 Tax=Hominilimicola sp. TaxID=3073571 RepID=UPI00399652D1